MYCLLFCENVAFIELLSRQADKQKVEQLTVAANTFG